MIFWVTTKATLQFPLIRKKQTKVEMAGKLKRIIEITQKLNNISTRKRESFTCKSVQMNTKLGP